MKRILALVTACLVLAVCFSIAAVAADKGGLPEIKPQAHENGWNRTTSYAGVVAGYGVQNIAVEGFNFADADGQLGAMVGFNWRAAPSLILGVEADFMLSGVKAEQSISGVTLSASNQFLGSIRGRAGAPIGPALLYVTAGLAMTETKYGLSGIGSPQTDKEFQYGIVFGGGMELEVGQALFLRAEALHYVMDDYKPLGASANAENEQTVFRAGFGFKLN